MIGWGFMSPANIPVPGLPMYYVSAALGRDGSPSRPFVTRDSHLIRLNGGLGEPALPNARSILSGSRSPFELIPHANVSPREGVYRPSAAFTN
jgi:hypothetical protein